MNITKKILKKLSLKIIADDKTIVNNQKLKDLIRKNSYVLSQLGIKKNDNVVIVLNNSLEFVISFLSTVNVCISAPLNPNYTEGEFNFYFSDLEPKLVITNFEDNHAAILCAKKFKIKILNIKSYIFQTNSKKSVKNILSSGLNNTALVLHTSGTTSKPKMVPLSHNNIINSALNISRSLKLSRKDKNIILMPSFHIHGIVASILAPLISGGKIVVLPKFNALSFYKSLASHSPSWFTGVPTMLQSILDRSEKNSKIINNHKLRFIRSSSASLPNATLKKLEKLFKVPVIESYGMTEASHQMTSNLLPPRKRKIGSVGVPEGIKVKVLNENYKKSKEYEVGEILVKGSSIFKKYIASKKINSKSFNKGWFRTGDLGFFDKDGYLFISGRIKEIINRGGEKISPKEVDEVFMNYKKVNKAVSFAIDHPKLGEDIGLAIVLNNNVKCTTSELKLFAQDKLAQYKIPKKIIFLKEIPLGATGKIQRIGLAKKIRSYIMRVCIYGAGAIGGMLGFLLQKSGVDVTLIARRNHYKEIKKNGLTFVSKEFNIEDTYKFKIFDNIENLGKFDLVINSLKAHSASQTANLVSNILDKNTILLPTLNGVPWWFFYKFGGKFNDYKLNSVDPEQKLWKSINLAKVIGCVVYPAAIIYKPGVIHHVEGKRFILGEPDNTRSERAIFLSKLLSNAGLKAPISKDIRSDIWLKLIGNSSFNPLSVITKNTLKEICDNEDTRTIIENMMKEAISIGKKLNIEQKLTIEKRIEGARNVGDHKTSTLQDFENKRPLELNALIKALIELGEITNTETPTLNTVYKLAKVLAENSGCPSV